MTRYVIHPFVSIALLALLLSVNSLATHDDSTDGGLSADSDNEMAFNLLQLQAEVQGSLNDQDSLVANAAEQLSSTGLEGEKAQAILHNLNNSGFAEAVTISQQGTILAVEPSRYSSSEGANVSSQDVWIWFSKSKTPVLSQMYHLVEGYDAISLIHPVLSLTGKFEGALSASMEPGEFLGAIITSNVKGTPYNAWVMQEDGLILYDVDPSQVGLMLFSDPLYQPYPSLLDIGRKMVAERSGMGSYYFLNKEHNQNVTKDVYWTTVGLHGNEWRLAIIRVAE